MSIDRYTMRGIALILGLLLVTGNAHAQNQTQPSVPLYPSDALPPTDVPQSNLYLQAIGSESGVFDSNPLMLTTGAKALYGSVAAPELVLHDVTPRSQLSVDELVQENTFNQSSFDSTDIHSKVAFDTKTPNWGLNVKQNVDYDTTRTSEFTNFGFVSAPVRHLGWSVLPNLSYKPTPIDELSIPSNLSVSHYEKNVFTDYTVMSVAPTLKHDFDPNDTGVFVVKGQRYRATTGVRNIVDTIGPALGWIKILTPRITANANVGMQRARQFGATSQPWQWQTTFDGGLSLKGEQDIAQITATRADQPFSNGTQSLLTSFGLSDTHKIHPRLAVNFGANYQTADYQAQTTGNFDTQFSGNGGITYNITEHLDLQGTYQYRHETLTNVSKPADDNMFTIGIVFHPHAWDL